MPHIICPPKHHLNNNTSKELFPKSDEWEKNKRYWNSRIVIINASRANRASQCESVNVCVWAYPFSSNTLIKLNFLSTPLSRKYIMQNFFFILRSRRRSQSRPRNVIWASSTSMEGAAFRRFLRALNTKSNFNDRIATKKAKKMRVEKRGDIFLKRKKIFTANFFYTAWENKIAFPRFLFFALSIRLRCVCLCAAAMTIGKNFFLSFLYHGFCWSVSNGCFLTHR